MASTKAYTSQFLALVMFALVMSEDRLSMVPRRLVMMVMVMVMVMVVVITILNCNLMC